MSMGVTVLVQVDPPGTSYKGCPLTKGKYSFLSISKYKGQWLLARGTKITKNVTVSKYDFNLIAFTTFYSLLLVVAWFGFSL
jgi:hypothetical protein